MLRETCLILIIILLTLFFGCEPSIRKQRIADAVNYVEDFQKKENRLPTIEEFDIWKKEVSILLNFNSKNLWVNGKELKGSNAYIIRYWDGDRSWIYSSVDKKLFTEE